MAAKTDRKATLIGKNGQAQGQLKEISNEGVTVLTPRGARVGTELEVVFEIPTSEYFRTLNILSTVVHRHHGENGIYLELQFNQLTANQKQYIGEFLDYKHRLQMLGRKTHHSRF